MLHITETRKLTGYFVIIPPVQITFRHSNASASHPKRSHTLAVPARDTSGRGSVSDSRPMQGYIDRPEQPEVCSQGQRQRC